MCVLQKYRSLGTCCREDSFSLPPNTISLSFILAECSVIVSLGELTLSSVVPAVEFFRYFSNIYLHGTLYKRFFVVRTYSIDSIENTIEILYYCVFFSPKIRCRFGQYFFLEIILILYTWIDVVWFVKYQLFFLCMFYFIYYTNVVLHYFHCTQTEQKRLFIFLSCDTIIIVHHLLASYLSEKNIQTNNFTPLNILIR